MTVIWTRPRTRERAAERGPFDILASQFGPDVARATKDEHGRWRTVTWAEVGRQKRARQRRQLERRRCVAGTEIRPIYVWVFHCPGVAGFAYYGWWVYLIGRDYSYGKYLERDARLMDRLMDLFPLGNRTLYGWDISIDTWKRRFARKYCCRDANGRPRKHAGRIQGKAIVWASFYSGHVAEIIRKQERHGNTRNSSQVPAEAAARPGLVPDVRAHGEGGLR